MRKLGKKLVAKKETLQAFLCNCDSACEYYCRPSPTSGPPSYAPQLGLISDRQA